MGVISARPRRDGTIGYTAQVKVRRGGRIVFSAAQTFDTEAQAQKWMARQEKAIAKPGALEAAMQKGGSLSDAIEKYVAESRQRIGRTKAQVLEAVKRAPIASMACADIGSRDIVSFAQDLGADRQPQTVLNYLSHLSAIFAVAKPAWGLDLDPAAMAEAMKVCKRLGLITKSKQRTRRPTLAEIDLLMEHFVDRQRRRGTIPMPMIVAFAIFSTRRQEEILTIQWADLEPGRILVRDMKHPGEKAGNDVWCELVPEAERIIRAMPRAKPQIFPFTTDAVSAGFTRACKLLGIEDLHFHDMRHEGISRLMEMGRTIPLAASVSGHRSWQSLQRYTHLRATGDKYEGWPWLDRLAPLPQRY